MKRFSRETREERRYSPPNIASMRWYAAMGYPDRRLVSTSRVERLNLSVRCFQKRWARLSLCFSKRLENLEAAANLFVGWFNFVRMHGSLNGTPAMAAGLTSEPWGLDQLLP